MGIGDANYGSSNGSYQSKTYEGTYYSRLVLKNSNHKRLSITYKIGLMVLEISNTTVSGDSFKSEVEEQIFLSPAKAHMLTNQINNMLEYRKSENVDPRKAFGVTAGMKEKVTFIAFSVDEDLSIVVTIGKFDSNGVITESAVFKFDQDFNYSLEWDDLAANSLTKVYDNEMDILMLRDAIADFSRAMSGAAGYATLDLNRYEAQKNYRRIDQIFDKLGIERATYGNRNYSGGNNDFLSNANSKSTSYEEIEDLLA